MKAPPTGLCPFLNSTAAFGSIYITRFIRKRNSALLRRTPPLHRQRSGQPPIKNRPTLKTSPSAKSPLTAAEQRAWNEALSYYSANYIDKDLLFTTELILIKNQLGDFDGCDELSGRKKKTCDAGLPANLTHVLEAAAPVYRAHQWPAHDLANRRWVMRVAPLVREQGLGLSQRLADIYQTKWPKDKIRVDVCAYANRSGAYTTLDPLRVTISSTDPRNQDAEAWKCFFTKPRMASRSRCSRPSSANVASAKKASRAICGTRSFSTPPAKSSAQ